VPCQPPHHNSYKFHLSAQGSAPIWCGGQVSVIIPTLNEEKYLPMLLESIRAQDFTDYDIIIADAGSKDKTLEIAEKYKCRIVEGGLPAEGRNNGAKSAKGKLLLFLDADVVLPPSFFSKTLKEFRTRNLDIASFFLIPKEKSKIASLLFSFFYNIPIFLLEKILAHGAMGILIKKELFEKLNGFDEGIVLAEDHEFVRRAKKIGKYGLIKSIKIFVSIRRFRKYGWFKIALKYFLTELRMIFIGPVRSGRYFEENKK